MSNEGTLQTINGEPTLRFERHLRHKPAKVWRAITEAAELKHWFPAAIEAELRPGAPMRFVFPDEAPVEEEWEGEVLEVDPPKVFMFRWNKDVLRFEVLPDGDGTRLVFTQSLGFGLLEAGRSAAGWEQCLDELTGRLEGREVPERTDWLPLIEHYLTKFGIDDGAIERVDGGYEVRFVRDLVWKPEEEVRPLLNQWSPDGEPADTVSWRVTADPKRGVFLHATQTVPEHLADQLPTTLATLHLRLELIFAQLHGDKRQWSQERVDELTKHYAAATA